MGDESIEFNFHSRGDKMSDIQAGQSAGIQHLYLVDSEYESDGVASGYQRCASLFDAVTQYFKG